MSWKHAGIWSLLSSARTRAALSLGVVLTVGATGTFAFWTDSATVSGTTFQAGTIDLFVNGGNTDTGFVQMNLATFVPGNTMAGIITVKNNGTAPLKYDAATASDVSTFSNALVVKVTGDSTTTGSSPAKTCAGAALSGTATTLNSTLITTKRQLAAGASETLCVQVTLPANANTSLQGAASAVTFTFTGTSDLS